MGDNNPLASQNAGQTLQKQLQFTDASSIITPLQMMFNKHLTYILQGVWMTAFLYLVSKIHRVLAVSYCCEARSILDNCPSRHIHVYC